MEYYTPEAIEKYKEKEPVIKKANKKKDVKLTSGILSVNTTTNNTLIVLSDKEGNKILG